MAGITVHNLTKRYGDARALDNVSLDIEPSEFLVLLGPSGCGKTTLLRCLAGLETPDEGEIVIDGKTVFSSDRKIEVPPGKRELGMVFQSYALWPHMTVRDNLKFGLDVLKIAKPAADERLDKILDDVGLGEFGERYPSELSGGQQQRVALARLLATQPSVFLMDEPLSNLDARLRMDMRVELKRFQAETGATTVYVTHDQTEAMTMATRVVVMKEGSIQQVSAPERLYRHPETTFVADFIGMPRINLIELDVTDHAETTFSNGDVNIDLGWVPGPDRVVVGARPEDIVLSEEPIEQGEEYEIGAVLPNGPETMIQLQRGKTSVIARVGHDTPLRAGQRVNLTFRTGSINVYDAGTRAIISNPTAVIDMAS